MLSGRMTTLPAVTGPETADDHRSSTSHNPNACFERSHTGHVSGPAGTALRQIRTVFAPAHASKTTRSSRNSPRPHSAIEAAVRGRGMVRGAGTEAASAAIDLAGATPETSR